VNSEYTEEEIEEEDHGPLAALKRLPTKVLIQFADFVKSGYVLTQSSL
jgi:hypothetical protein